MFTDLKTLASVDVDAFSLIDNHKFCGAKSRNFDKAIIYQGLLGEFEEGTHKVQGFFCGDALLLASRAARSCG